MTAKSQFRALLKAQGGSVSPEVESALLIRAKDDALSLCNTRRLPRGADSAVAELAIAYYNKIGAEGEARRTEGDISYAFEGGIPKNIVMRLKRFNKGRVI